MSPRNRSLAAGSGCEAKNRGINPTSAPGKSMEAVSMRVPLVRPALPRKNTHIQLLNHRPASLDARIGPGDRLAVFPPELAFNLIVALELAPKGRRNKTPKKRN